MFKGSNVKFFKARLFSLLPSSLLSSLSSSHLSILREYEAGCRDELFKFDNARMGFYLLCALDSDRFKGLVLEALKTDSEHAFKRYHKQWKMFLRLLLVHAVAPQACEPLPLDHCNKYTGDKTNVMRFIMWEDGWILKTGWRNHFRISPKGAKICEAIIKQCEREYSEYYVSLIEYKREKMGDLADD